MAKPNTSRDIPFLVAMQPRMLRSGVKPFAYLRAGNVRIYGIFVTFH